VSGSNRERSRRHDATSTYPTSIDINELKYSPTLYIGLDVHKEKTSVALADPDAKGGARLHGEVTTSHITLDHIIRRIAKSKTISVSQISVCYEACGCGMWIAWMFMTKKFNPPSSPFSHGIC
jgi:hypothetical protein